VTSELPDVSADPASQRLPFWPNVSASFKHIRESVRTEGSNIRKSDPFTVWLVPAVVIMLAGATLLGTWARLAFGLAAFASVMFYILGRIGIVRGMNHRQTNMVWHLLLVSFIGGLLFAFFYLEILKLISPVHQ
jgi:hypothetical protein